MAKRVTITNQGAALLASSSEATGQYYWLGYYALAYVPNVWKEATVSLPTDPDDCDNVNGTPDIGPTDTDQVTASMTRLTKYGDMIYNIWQGDLNGTGFFSCSSDGSPGGDLFGLTMYNTNIKKHYRYVLSETGCNTLVTWINDPTNNDGVLLGKHVYIGTDGYVSSKIPIPAPLYYVGDVTGKISVDNFFDEFPTFEEMTGPSGNGADLYPYLADLGLKPAGVDTLDVPKVSADYRGYLDSQGNDGTSPYDHSTAGQYFDSLEIPYAVDSGFDETSWFASDLTYSIDDFTPSGFGFSPVCTEFWKLLSISNYNRFHAPVSSVGHVLTSDLSNRNMAKVTKFFPISDYKVMNAQSGFTSNNEAVEVATAIRLGIKIDLAPRTLSQGFDSNCDYDETSNLEFFDKYDRTGLTPNPATLGDGSTTPNDNINKANIFNSTHCSFKFNRIGVYAVPLRKSPYVQDQGFGTDPTGQNVELEFQINPDEEPILFAVVDWDNTVLMSDTGDGIHEFNAELTVNLESPDGVEDTALVRDATIFYNLYEDDAITWYQNQLIANASTQNAITEIGLEVANLKNRSTSGDCCPPPDYSNLFAAKNHSHTGLGLRNLKDANTAVNGGIKGINTKAEGSVVDGEIYTLGLNAFVFGDSISSSSASSAALAGINNYINKGSDYSSIIGGVSNYITSTSVGSSILSASSSYITGSSVSFIAPSIICYIANSVCSSIISASSSYITGANNCSILSGIINSISGPSFGSAIVSGSSNVLSSVTQSGIFTGTQNSITNGVYSAILSGRTNVLNSEHSAILSGYTNYIASGSNYSIIGSGQSNTIGAAATHAFIGGGSSNYIYTNAIYSVIVGGYDNTVYSAGTYSTIVGGSTNYIGVTNYGFVGGGKDNAIGDGSHSAVIVGGESSVVTSSSHSFVGAGIDNIIASAAYSSIIGGNSNTINNAAYTVISGGSNNYIGSSASFSFIGSGGTNTIGVGSTYATIINGSSNLIGSSTLFSFIGSGNDNYIANGSYISVIAGYTNQVTGTGNNHLTILGGSNNDIVSSTYSIIGGGDEQTIGSSTYSSIVGGRLNHINDSDYAVISGGYNNYINVANYASIPGGYGAFAQNISEIAHADGSFAVQGDRQNSRVMCSWTSSTAAFNDRRLNLSDGNYIKIKSGNTSVAGTVLVHASMYDPTACSGAGSVYSWSKLISFTKNYRGTTYSAWGVPSTVTLSTSDSYMYWLDADVCANYDVAYGGSILYISVTSNGTTPPASIRFNAIVDYSTIGH